MKIVITGWKPPLAKLPLSKYLESDFGFDLKSSGKAVHALLREGQPIVLSVEPWRLDEVVSRLEEFGTQVEVTGD